MVNKIKELFALTDSGARGMIKASIGSFLMYIAYMLPMILLMYFSKEILIKKPLQISIYILAILVISIVMFILINIAYETTYNETYKEAKNLRIHIAEILKELPLSYFSKHDISDLSQTVMQDVADIEHALSHAIPEMIGFIIYLLVIGILLISGNTIMGLVAIVPIFISLILIWLSKKMQVLASTKYFYQKRKSAELFQESIEMQQEIKSYGRKEEFKEKLIENFNKQEKLQIRTELAQAIPVSLIGMMLRLSLGFTIVIGSYLFINNRINILYFIGYVVASTRMIDGGNGLILNIAEILYIDARIVRIRELYKQELQKGEKTEFQNYDILLDKVSFSYQDKVKAIDNVSFMAKQNTVTALIGPSGCGKTTLLRLMSRLYDYDKGNIYIDGKDIKGIATESMFQNISIVFQDITLFNMSIMENIRLGKVDADDKEVIRASKIANCHEFIEKLPEGYQTIVGENGMKLSGGERQRISIARAILKDAPIILLDEISSALDVENEAKIQEGLKYLMRGKTVVMISHRLRSIQNAHQIVVMDQGKVVDIGTHEELMKYSKLYALLREKEMMTQEFTY